MHETDRSRVGADFDDEAGRGMVHDCAGVPKGDYMSSGTKNKRCLYLVHISQ